MANLLKCNICERDNCAAWFFMLKLCANLNCSMSPEYFEIYDNGAKVYNEDILIASIKKDIIAGYIIEHYCDETHMMNYLSVIINSDLGSWENRLSSISEYSKHELIDHFLFRREGNM